MADPAQMGVAGDRRAHLRQPARLHARRAGGENRAVGLAFRTGVPDPGIGPAHPVWMLDRGRGFAAARLSGEAAKRSSDCDFRPRIPALAFGRLAQVQSTVASLPLIHDISTDTQDPPEFGSVIQAERAEVEGVNTLDYAGKMAPTRQTDADGKPVQRLVSALQTQAYPEIRTLVVSEPPEVTFGRAEQLARDLGWEIKESDMSAGRIEATDTTFWYGFEDDISIRLRPAAGDGTRVDARSVSRVGLSDIGKNAARLREFLDAMAEGER